MPTRVEEKSDTLTQASTDDKLSDGQLNSEAPPGTPPDRVEIAEALDEGVVAEHEDDKLPNGGYGWVVVCCILALNACTWGCVPLVDLR